MGLYGHRRQILCPASLAPGDFSGTYTVAPVASTPEPSTLLLLFLSALALASGMAWRRKTPYVTVLSTPAANPW